MMDKNNKNEKSNVGLTAGVAIGFMAGLLLNVVFIPISIGVGALYDKYRNKKRDE
jgi:hypothetical protein